MFSFTSALALLPFYLINYVGLGFICMEGCSVVCSVRSGTILLKELIRYMTNATWHYCCDRSMSQ